MTTTCKFITTQTDLDLPTYGLEVLDEIANAPIKGFDYETTGLDPYTLEPLGLAIWGYGQKYVIDLRTFDPADVGDAINKIKGGKWVAHNAVFDMTIMKYHHFVDIDEMDFWCSMVASQVLYNGSELDANLADLVAFHFHEVMSKEVRKSFINRPKGIKLSLEDIQYMERDIHFLPMLYEKQATLLKNKDMLDLMLEIENPLMPVLSNMWLAGVNLDQKKWIENANKYEEDCNKTIGEARYIVQLIAEQYDLTPMLDTKAKREAKAAAKQGSLFDMHSLTSAITVAKKFNPASNEQIKFIIRTLGVNIPDSNAETLEKQLLVLEDGLARDFINVITKLRVKQKLVSTYGRGFLKYINPMTDRIHTNLTQAFTDTGRLSSRKPNLQNIPAEEEIRSCFIPDSNEYYIVTIDFTGQELCIAAAYSEDEILLKSIKEGMDLHSYLAQGSFRLILNDPEYVVSKKVNVDKRNDHKPCLFGHIYGAEASRQAAILNITKKKGQMVTNWLNQAMPGLAKYQNKIKSAVVRDRRVFDGTRYNRRKLFNWRTTKSTRDDEMERQGCNFPIQATGATMSKEAMIKCHRYILANQLHIKGTCIKLAVHDELVFQVHKSHLDHAYQFQRIMDEVGTSYLRGKVEMKSSINIAECWQK